MLFRIYGQIKFFLSTIMAIKEYNKGRLIAVTQYKEWSREDRSVMNRES